MEVCIAMGYTVAINGKSYPILSDGFSLKQAVGAEGKHEASSCQISVRGEDILSVILYEEGLLDAIVKDGEGNTLFTGVIRPYASTVVNQTSLESISLEVLDYTEKMHIKVYETPENDSEKVSGIIYSDTWDGYKISDPTDIAHSVVHKILSLAGITKMEIPSINEVLFRYSLNSGDYLDERLAALLYEYMYDYRFDENGKFIIFQTAPIVTSWSNEVNKPNSVKDIESAGEVSSFIHNIKISRSDDKKDGAKVSFREYKTTSNVLLYETFMKGWAGLIAIDNNWWFAKKKEVTWDKSRLSSINAKDIILNNFWIGFENASTGIANIWCNSKNIDSYNQDGGVLSWDCGASAGLFGHSLKEYIRVYAYD